MVIVDLGSAQPISHIKVEFLQGINSWIWYPSSVTFEVATTKNDF